MKVRPRTFAPAAVLGVAVALILGACGTTDADTTSEGGLKGPGVDSSAKTITIGEISALSGPAESVGIPVHDGLETYLKWFNDNGGVDGWKIKLDARDSAYNPQKTVQLFNELKDNVTLLNSFGTPTTAAIRPLIDEQKLVTGGAGIDWSDDPQLALLGTPYAPAVADLVTYVATEKAGKDSKYGIFYQNDAFGQANLAGYESAAKTLDLNSVSEVNYKPGDTDFSAQAAKLKASGADYVVIGAISPNAASLIGTAGSLGYEPTWLFAAPLFDPVLITDDGTATGKKTAVAPLIVGHSYASTYTTPYDASSPAPGFADVEAAHKKFRPKTPINANFTYGWSLGKIYTAIVEKAIADGDLSREGILKAKQSLGEVDLAGLASNPTYGTASAEPPSRAVDVAVVDDTAPGFLRVESKGYTSDAAASLKPSS